MKSESKMMSFAVMLLYEMLPNQFTSSTWRLMRDTAMSNQLLVAHLWQVMPMPYSAGDGWKKSALCQQIWVKADAVWSHDTLWDAAKSCNIIYLGLMRDPAMCNQLLVSHLWQVMPYFSHRMWLKNMALCHYVGKSESKLMLLAVMLPYEMLPNHFTSPSNFVSKSESKLMLLAVMTLSSMRCCQILLHSPIVLMRDPPICNQLLIANLPQVSHISAGVY
jgi:hypothetical protein